MLGRRAGDAGGVGLLKRVIADQMGGHLAGQADHRNAVHQRIREAGDRIGGAGAGGDQHHADLAGGPRIAFGRMHGRLFMPDQDMANMVLLEQRIVKRQNGAARDSRK